MTWNCDGPDELCHPWRKERARDHERDLAEMEQ